MQLETWKICKYYGHTKNSVNHITIPATIILLIKSSSSLYNCTCDGASTLSLRSIQDEYTQAVRRVTFNFYGFEKKNIKYLCTGLELELELKPELELGTQKVQTENQCIGSQISMCLTRMGKKRWNSLSVKLMSKK